MVQQMSNVNIGGSTSQPMSSQQHSPGGWPSQPSSNASVSQVLPLSLKVWFWISSLLLLFYRMLIYESHVFEMWVEMKFEK